MNKTIPGHYGILVDVEDGRDIWEALVAIRNQVENIDPCHFSLEILDKAIEDIQTEVE